MLRVLLICAVIAFAPVASVFAESRLLESGTRLAQHAARQVVPAAMPSARSAATAQGNLAASGMGKKKKLLFGIVAGLGFAGGVWAIDRGVEDNTPSTRGTRKD